MRRLHLTTTDTTMLGARVPQPNMENWKWDALNTQAHPRMDCSLFNTKFDSWLLLLLVNVVYVGAVKRTTLCLMLFSLALVTIPCIHPEVCCGFAVSHKHPHQNDNAAIPFIEPLQSNASMPHTLTMTHGSYRKISLYRGQRRWASVA